MKKLIVTAILSTALAAGVVTAGGCSASTSPEAPSVTDNIQTTDDFYSYGAASVGSIISSVNANASVNTASSVASANASACNTFMSVEVTEETEGTGETGDSDGTEETGATEETEGTGETGDSDGTESTGATEETGATEGNEETEGTGENTENNPFIPDGNNPPAPPAGFDAPFFNPSAEPTEEQLETINAYMSLVENLLGDGKVSSVQSQSDREGYEIKEEVSYSDLEGNTLTYTMYYNRTLVSVETESHDNHDEHGFEEGFEETESEYSLEGIMIIDGAEYAMEGYYETEVSAKGEETESYFKVVLGEGSYVIMEQENEDDERSLIYKVVEEYRVVEKTKFEYETEHGETELKMSIEKNGVFSEIKFSEENEHGVRVIKVDATENGSHVSFKIYVTVDEDGNEVYRYTFGEKIKDFRKMFYEKHQNEAKNAF